MSVQELEAEIARLSPTDIKKLADWFDEFKADAWDGQPEVAAASGKSDKSAKQSGSLALNLKTFDLGAKLPLPTRAELADEMFDRE
jgi:hypothetical protein